MTEDMSFCVTESGQCMLATAVGSRVEIWKLQQPEGEDADQIEPAQSITKFTEHITSLKLRDDGKLILVGDKSGKIELVELQQKMSLRVYENEHKNQINYLDFSCQKRSFVSCANESSWKFFDI